MLSKLSYKSPLGFIHIIKNSVENVKKNPQKYRNHNYNFYVLQYLIFLSEKVILKTYTLQS